LPKGSRTICAEAVKMYEVHIPLKCIQDSPNPLLKTIELIYEAIKIFLIATYKKIKPEFLDELWKFVDLDYLVSLPYPAPFSDRNISGINIYNDFSSSVQAFY
jgi:hypothetical protein